jgi:secreted PhoX family phosphatase
MTLKLRFGVDADQDAPGDGPDNITVSPWGGLILAEDGEGVQHLVGVTEGGAAFELARDQLNGSEFVAPVYSHDKKVLFASIQTPGIMFAITGPWRNQR